MLLILGGNHDTNQKFRASIFLKKLMLLFRKNALNWSNVRAGTVIMSHKIFISNK